MNIQARALRQAVKAKTSDILVLWYDNQRVIVNRKTFAQMLAPIPADAQIHIQATDAFTIREMTNGNRTRDVKADEAIRFYYAATGVKTTFRVVSDVQLSTWEHRRRPTLDSLDLNSIGG